VGREELKLRQDARQYRECGYGKRHANEDDELREAGLVCAVHCFAEEDDDADAGDERKRDTHGGDAEGSSAVPANGMEIELQTYEE